MRQLCGGLCHDCCTSSVSHFDSCCAVLQVREHDVCRLHPYQQKQWNLHQSYLLLIIRLPHTPAHRRMRSMRYASSISVQASWLLSPCSAVLAVPLSGLAAGLHCLRAPYASAAAVVERANHCPFALKTLLHPSHLMACMCTCCSSVSPLQGATHGCGRQNAVSL